MSRRLSSNVIILKQSQINHYQNIYAEGELSENATTEDFSVVRQEDVRQVKRQLKHYNSDAIISVGYRVQSHTATRFRQWATQQLQEYIVKGFLLNNDRLGEKLDGFLTLNDCNILDYAGKVSHQMAKQLAEQEYERFHQ